MPQGVALGSNKHSTCCWEFEDYLWNASPLGNSRDRDPLAVNTLSYSVQNGPVTATLSAPKCSLLLVDR